MVGRVGVSSQVNGGGLVAAQLLRVREASAGDGVWSKTGRVQLASSFLASLVSGKWVPMGEAEACATGMWSGQWDDLVLDIVGGSREEGRRVRGWLGEVDTSSGGARVVGLVGRYLVERYGFDPETIVTGFTTDYLAAYLSVSPALNPGSSAGGDADAVLQFGPMDMMLTPATTWRPSRFYNLFPHPAQDLSVERERRYIGV